ncbi:MAG: hypothetical protein ABI837_15925, partial [Acidobacteriota bacterium]
LKLAYETLLAGRKEMIETILPLDPSEHNRTIVVDALISGLVAHFHDIGRNQMDRKEEMDGKDFATYITNLASEVTIMFTSRFPSPANGKRRAV